VPHNTAPFINLSRPVDGAHLDTTSIELQTNALDRDGNLKSVNFYSLPSAWKNWFLRKDEEVKEVLSSAIHLGEVTHTSNDTFTLTWSDPPSGLHNIIALARDTDGMASFSNISRITVGMRNLSRNCKVEASSNANGAVQAVDDDLFSSWNGDKEGEQWLSVDLGSEQAVGGVIVAWSKAYARSFRVQVSADGEKWDDVFHTDSKKIWHGDSDVIRFPQTDARYLRLFCTQPGTNWGGYSVYELCVFDSIPQ
jgi:hypothetical protein